jgi:hypothetical protein
LLNIIFTDLFNFGIEQPKPASFYVPDWYKQHESYTGNKKIPTKEVGRSPATIKRCMPVFDVITSGYIITLPVDVYVRIIEDKEGKRHQVFEWSDKNIIEFHPIEQAKNHPLQNEFAYPKFMNFWGIKTPKGYSTLFVQPFHRESVFTILPGIVDTDIYNAPVNFPFVINDTNFEGYIKQGTPIAQLIPIKRDSWVMTMEEYSDPSSVNKIFNKIYSTFFDGYKRNFWHKKEYK